MPSKKQIAYQYAPSHKCSSCGYEKRQHSPGKLLCPASLNAFGTTYKAKDHFVPAAERKVVIRGQDSKKLYDPL